MEHGWTGRVSRAETAEHKVPRTRRFDLSKWLPSAILARGGSPSRDAERMYMDLQGARDARESGR
jgi:hypothetical protein